MRDLTYFPLLQRYPVTSPYGYRVDPITGAVGSFHGGVDFGAPWGAPVIAPFDGQVTTGYESGAGNWSWVDNGSDRFKSFHHDHAEVTSGWVAAGTVIAYIDSTGSSTGAHAHLELWEGGTRIDPTWYFDNAPLWQEAEEDMPLNEDDLNAIDLIVKRSLDEYLKRYVPLNALWTDGAAQYEVTVDGEGRRIRRRIRSTDEFNLLKVGRAITGSWVVDVSGDPDLFNSWPLAPESDDEPATMSEDPVVHWDE